MNNVIIKAENVSKIYKLYSSPKDRLKEALHPLRKQYHQEFEALKDVSFIIKKGESVGILGTNGAGKSTLLKILTGVLKPTSGKVSIHGRIAALLELGSGFNPELTGMENIYFQAAIMGISEEDIESKLDEIMSFADIGEFIYQPVKTYSSGMFARLAFSIAINVSPDILIVDEALSVGDAFFQAKCFLKIKELKQKNDLTFIFVSHSTAAVRSLCSKALLLSQGRMISFASSSEVAELYFNRNVKSTQGTIDVNSCDVIGEEDFNRKVSFGRIQNGLAYFKKVEILDNKNSPISLIEFGQSINVKMTIECKGNIDLLAFGLHIRNQDGVDVLFTASGMGYGFLEKVREGEIVEITNNFTLEIHHGKYTLAVVLSRPLDLQNGVVDYCDFIPIALSFEMLKREPAPIYGLVAVQNTVTINRSRLAHV